MNGNFQYGRVLIYAESLLQPLAKILENWLGGVRILLIVKKMSSLLWERVRMTFYVARCSRKVALNCAGL